MFHKDVFSSRAYFKKSISAYPYFKKQTKRRFLFSFERQCFTNCHSPLLVSNTADVCRALVCGCKGQADRCFLRSPDINCTAGAFHLSGAQKAGNASVIGLLISAMAAISNPMSVCPKIRKDSTNSMGHLFRSFVFSVQPKAFLKNAHRLSSTASSSIRFPEKYFCSFGKWIIGCTTRIRLQSSCFLPLVQVQRTNSYSCSPLNLPPSWSSTHIDFCEAWILNTLLSKLPSKEASLIPPIASYSYADMGSTLRESQLPDRPMHKKTLNAVSFPSISKRSKTDGHPQRSDWGTSTNCDSRLSKVRLSRIPISLQHNPTDRKRNSKLINRSLLLLLPDQNTTSWPLRRAQLLSCRPGFFQVQIAL